MHAWLGLGSSGQHRIGAEDVVIAGNLRLRFCDTQLRRGGNRFNIHEHVSADRVCRGFAQAPAGPPDARAPPRSRRRSLRPCHPRVVVGEASAACELLGSFDLGESTGGRGVLWHGVQSTGKRPGSAAGAPTFHRMAELRSTTWPPLGSPACRWISASANGRSFRCRGAVVISAARGRSPSRRSRSVERSCGSPRWIQVARACRDWGAWLGHGPGRSGRRPGRSSVAAGCGGGRSRRWAGGWGSPQSHGQELGPPRRAGEAV